MYTKLCGIINVDCDVINQLLCVQEVLKTREIRWDYTSVVERLQECVYFS
jgi:hypothetical protein